MSLDKNEEALDSLKWSNAPLVFGGWEQAITFV
jgi:hypothetical protein